MRRIKNRAEAYELGYRLGEVRGTYEATAATPAEARALDRLALAMINAVHAAAIGNDAGDYRLHDAWSAGINAGRASKLNEAAHEYGQENRIEGALRRALESLDEAARA